MAGAPSDIHPLTGCRLPPVDPKDLDENGRRAYERATKPGATIAGLQGPAGVQIHSPGSAPHVAAINRYLRYEAGFSGRVREIMILSTAREMDSQFEWVAHEDVALQEGVPPEVIDVIRHRRPTAELEATDALIIDLVRQLWRDHKVKSETFAAVREKFGSKGAVELVMLSGNYAGTAALLAAVDMQLHPGRTPRLPIP